LLTSQGDRLEKRGKGEGQNPVSAPTEAREDFVWGKSLQQNLPSRARGGGRKSVGGGQKQKKKCHARVENWPPHKKKVLSETKKEKVKKNCYRRSVELG